MATVFDFLQAEFFTMSDAQRSDFEQFVLAFDTTFVPIVGQQVTLTSSNAAVAGPRVDLMLARAGTAYPSLGQPDAEECDLIAKAVVNGVARGYLYMPGSGTFQSDRQSEAAVSDNELRTLASADGGQVTYTCAPPGEGVRLGLDRDEDMVFDRDEIDAGTDPADPRDPFEQSPTPRPTATRTLTPSATPTETETPRPTRATRSSTPTVSLTPTPAATVTPTQRADLPGDADCNGVVNAADVSAACRLLFEGAASAPCGADCNRDGSMSAGDVTCIAALIPGSTRSTLQQLK
jgi:hypothetical protein